MSEVGGANFAIDVLSDDGGELTAKQGRGWCDGEHDREWGRRWWWWWWCNDDDGVADDDDGDGDGGDDGYSDVDDGDDVVDDGGIVCKFT